MNFDINPLDVIIGGNVIAMNCGWIALYVQSDSDEFESFLENNDLYMLLHRRGATLWLS